MNRLALRALACALAIAAFAVPVAGCGSSSQDKAASPLDNALGYVPSNSPLVISFETDPSGEQFKAAKRIVEKFPFANQIEQGLQQQLTQQSVSYERDLKPLLGNEFVVAATSTKSIVNNSSNDKDFVGAIQAKDGAKLEDAVKKENAKEDGEQDGAKIYKDKSGDPFAIKGDVLVVAGSRALLDKALSSRGSDNRFTEEDFDKGTEGLPKDAALRLYTDLQSVIAADPSTADARKVKWVKALRAFGLTASASGDHLNVDFKLGTDSSGLTDADLPIASGDQSPDVIARKGQLSFGVRDIGQVVKFGESAGQAVDPSQFGNYETGKRAIESKLNIDIQKDVIDQLGDVSINAPASGGKASVKAKVKDPAGFKRTVAKVSKVLPDLAGGRSVKITKAGGGLYSVTTSSGTMSYGVIGDSFVFADSAAGARLLARAPAAAVPAAQGSVVMEANAEQLVTQALRRLSGSGLSGGQLGLGAALGGAVFAAPLGDLTGSAKADTSGITGKVSLGFD